MNIVKREEEPAPLGFSATRLGMDKSLEKLRNAPGGAGLASTHDVEGH
jgi:hypothetical protein